MRHLRTARVPWPVAVRRRLRKPLLVITANAGRDVKPREILPGNPIELCDIEGESALLHSDGYWLRAHIDELLNATEPDPAVHGLV